MSTRTVIIPFFILALALTPLAAAGQSEEIDVSAFLEELTCASISLSATVSGGSGVYDLTWDFGDGETLSLEGISEFPVYTDYTYMASGAYTWSLTATDSADAGLSGYDFGEAAIGPGVTLNSDPSPPMLTLVDGQATVNFTADTGGGTPPYDHEWDLAGASSTTTDGNTASATYTSEGEYLAGVTATDGCGLSTSDTLTVIVVDSTSDEACHPAALRIAEALGDYTCEDIYNFLHSDGIAANIGLGRLWHAYQLSRFIHELTWEQILDWHLDGTGWGLLTQLDRLADHLTAVGLEELVELVKVGGYTVNDIRTAVRMVIEYDADFQDALARLSDGDSPGELRRFYDTAAELGVDAETLDSLLESGISLAEARQAARLAESTGEDWQTLLEAHADGYSWGEIQQAIRLASEEGEIEEILEAGVQETRREQQHAEREEAQAERQAEQNDRTAARLAEQFGVTEAEVMELYDGVCAGDWNCVRDQLRSAQQESNPPEGRGRGNDK
jgi:PKD repeat protein